MDLQLCIFKAILPSQLKYCVTVLEIIPEFSFWKRHDRGITDSRALQGYLSIALHCSRSYRKLLLENVLTQGRSFSSPELEPPGPLSQTKLIAGLTLRQRAYLFGPIFQLVQLVFFRARVTNNSGPQWRRLVVLVEILAQINKPFAVVSALQSVWFIST